MKPSTTRVASMWSARQGSRTIWRGMRLKLHPGAKGAAKRLAAAEEKMSDLFYYSNDTYQEFIQTTPKAKKLHDKIELYRETILKAVLSSFKEGHVGIYWSRSKKVAENFAVSGPRYRPGEGRPDFRPDSTTETYVLLEGTDPGVGADPSGIFWDESEVTLPKGTPVKLQDIYFWGSDLGEDLEDAKPASLSRMTVKA